MQVDDNISATPGQCLTTLLSNISSSVRGGEGTFTDPETGLVFASILGKVILTRSSTENSPVTVEVLRGQSKAQVLPSVGINVTGRVLRVNNRQCDVQILCVQDRAVKGSGFRGILRKENVRTFEIDQVSLYDCFRVGDIVKCRVAALGTARSYELSTCDNELGVLHATCAGSGQFMVPNSWETMRCPLTGAIEKRKVAKVL